MPVLALLAVAAVAAAQITDDVADTADRSGPTLVALGAVALALLVVWRTP